MMSYAPGTAFWFIQFRKFKYMPDMLGPVLSDAFGGLNSYRISASKTFTLWTSWGRQSRLDSKILSHCSSWICWTKELTSAKCFIWVHDIHWDPIHSDTRQIIANCNKGMIQFVCAAGILWRSMFDGPLHLNNLSPRRISTFGCITETASCFKLTARLLHKRSVGAT